MILHLGNGIGTWLTQFSESTFYFFTGCLKAEAANLFNPSLPVEKMEVIEKLSFGNMAKMFLEYEEAFWERDVSRISRIWDDDSVASVSTSQTEWLKHLNVFTVMKPEER